MTVSPTAMGAESAGPAVLAQTRRLGARVLAILAHRAVDAVGAAAFRRERARITVVAPVLPRVPGEAARSALQARLQPSCVMVEERAGVAERRRRLLAVCAILARSEPGAVPTVIPILSACCQPLPCPVRPADAPPQSRGGCAAVASTIFTMASRTSRRSRCTRSRRSTRWRGRADTPRTGLSTARSPDRTGRT